MQVRRTDQAKSSRVGRRRFLAAAATTAVTIGAGLLPDIDRALSLRLPPGQPASPANQALLAQAMAFLTTPQRLVLGTQQWSVSRQALGLSFQPIPITEPGAWATALLNRPTIRLEPAIDLAQLGRSIKALPDLERSPIDAVLSWGDGAVKLEPERPGRRTDLARLAGLLQDNAARQANEAIVVPVQLLPAELGRADLAATADLLQRVLAQPLVVVAEQFQLVVPPALLAQAIKQPGPAQIELDDQAWAALLQPLANRLQREPVEPRLVVEPPRVRIEPAIPGRLLAIEPTTDAIWAALQNGRREAIPVVAPVPARLSEADLAPALVRATQLINEPPVLVVGKQEIALEAAMLARLLRTDGTTLTIDRTAAQELLAQLNQTTRQLPRSAFYRWRGGRAVEEVAGVAGRQLALAPSLDHLTEQLQRGERRISLPTTDLALETIMPADPNFSAILAEGRTYFGDSAPDRYRNVALGLARINGALVAPGATFSFNQASGPVTLEAGFRKGYGIAISNGQVTTLPSVGGGICQVATTVFHAAFRAGLSIIDRSWHLYWMPRYGRPPSGMTGLDATVDDQVGLDFTFANTTGNWLLVEALAIGGEAVVRLRGIVPAWRVTIEGPFISNIVRASTKMVERRDPSLPAGSRVWVEHAEDGKTVSIRRRVRQPSGELIEDRTFVATYAPAANVTLVGTGGR